MKTTDYRPHFPPITPVSRAQTARSQTEIPALIPAKFRSEKKLISSVLTLLAGGRIKNVIACGSGLTVGKPSR